MTKKPRKHHFIPQFWIKNFRHIDKNYHVYDSKDCVIKITHPRNIMQIYDLYTVDPLGSDDVTLETIDLNKIDSAGSVAFKKLVNKQFENGLRDELASFFAVQIFRDPIIVRSYAPKAQELTLSLLDVSNSGGFESFKILWEAQFPGATISEDEYSHLKKQSSIGNLEKPIENIINALSQPGGIPELPFTDLVTSQDSIDIVKRRLLNMQWILKETNKSFILGDKGIIYNERQLTDISVPISVKSALIMRTTEKITSQIQVESAKDFEVSDLNFSSSSCARRWIIGEPSTLENLKTQVGKNIF